MKTGFWIHVNNLMPKEGIDVLVNVNDNGEDFPYVAQNIGGYFFTPFEQLFSVTHWRMLPPSPKHKE